MLRWLKKLSIVFYSCLFLSGCLLGTIHLARASESVSSVQLFIVGASTMEPPIPNYVRDIARTRGRTLTFAHHYIPGSPPAVNWENHKLLLGDAESDPWEELPKGTYNVLIGSGGNRADDAIFTTYFADLGRTGQAPAPDYTPFVQSLDGSDLEPHILPPAPLGPGNPKLKTFLHYLYPDLTNPETGKVWTPAEYREQDSYYREGLDSEEDFHVGVEQAATFINRERSDAPKTYIFPEGLALANLYDHIVAGEVPTLTGIEDLYRDNGHLNEKGNYFQALIWYAVMFRDSPLGAPHILSAYPNQPWIEADVFDSEMAKAMQEIAWGTVRTYKYSGLSTCMGR